MNLNKKQEVVGFDLVSSSTNVSLGETIVLTINPLYSPKNESQQPIQIGIFGNHCLLPRKNIYLRAIIYTRNMQPAARGPCRPAP